MKIILVFVMKLNYNDELYHNDEFSLKQATSTKNTDFHQLMNFYDHDECA